MKATRLAGAIVPILLLTIASGAMAGSRPVGKGPHLHLKAGPKAGVVHPRGPRNTASRAATTSANMTNHGGPVMTGTVNTAAIFWGPKWGDGTTTFAGDKITGLRTFYEGWNGSNYAKTVTEYHSAGNTSAKATAASTYSGFTIDTSTASGGQRTSAILAEVARMVNAGRITVDNTGNSYVAVYTDLPRGGAQYCAWHSSGTFTRTATNTTVRVQFAFFWSLDGDPGCDPGDTTTGHSQGLAALANVSAHELAEAVTDPRLNAWYDSSGAENADKCGWTFNGLDSVQFSNGSRWKVQGEWSNAAYTAGTGYANRSGQKGCIDGH